MTRPIECDPTPVAPPARPTRRVADAFCCAGLVALCLAIGLPRYRTGIDLSDEGFLAYGAVRVMEGQVPNRDFVSLQPPLSFYLIAAVFTVLGTSLASLRIVGLCLSVIIPLLLYILARQRVGPFLALAAAVPATVLGIAFFGFVPFAVWQGTTAALAATICLVRGVVTGGRYWAIAAGLATAGTILSRHDQGFYLVLSVLAYASALRFVPGDERQRPGRVLFYWVLGTAAPLLVLGIGWLSAGALPFMFQQLVVFPLTVYSKTSSLPMPVFQTGLSASGLVVVGLFYLPPVVDALVGVWLFVTFVRRRNTVQHAHLAFLLALSVLFYCQVLTRSDLNHLMITLAPFFVVVVWSAAMVRDAIDPGRATRQPLTLLARMTSPPTIAMTVLGVGGLVYLDVILNRGDSPSNERKGPRVALHLPRGGVELDAKTARGLENVVHATWTHAPAGRAILALPYNPGLYFLTERRNPTRWNYLWPGDQTADEQRALIEQAKRDPPAVVILQREDQMETYARPIVEYVKASYRRHETFGGLTIYCPRTNDRPHAVGDQAHAATRVR